MSVGLAALGTLLVGIILLYREYRRDPTVIDRMYKANFGGER